MRGRGEEGDADDSDGVGGATGGAEAPLAAPFPLPLLPLAVPGASIDDAESVGDLARGVGKASPNFPFPLAASGTAEPPLSLSSSAPSTSPSSSPPPSCPELLLPRGSPLAHAASSSSSISLCSLRSCLTSP